MNFTVLIRFSENQEDGSLKKVTRPYHIVSAVSYSEAETQIYFFCENEGLADFDIKKITKTDISDVIDKDGELWCKAKVSYMALDEDAGKEKRVVDYMLISGKDLDSAYEELKTELKGFSVPYEVHSITETKLEGVITYDRSRD